MDILQQAMLGIGLASCAGLRAWLPLFGAGMLARWGYIPIDGTFDILKSDGTLIVLGIATVIETLGDKIVVLDNLLDSLGTILRPAAGAVVAAGMFTTLDPMLQAILGIILGGGTALTVHAGKAAPRGGATVMAPAHGGLMNAGVSIIEDLVAVGGVWLAVIAPLLVFALAILLLILAVWFIRRIHLAGRKVFGYFRER